jgi:hypothetical protein
MMVKKSNKWYERWKEGACKEKRGEGRGTEERER